MFIVILQYIQPIAAIEENLSEHREFLDKHYAMGNFIASGPQVPRTGGAILVKELTRQQLDDVIQQDPFHREKVATYQIIEFTPTKFTKGAEEVLT